MQLTIRMHHGEKIYRHTEHARYSVKMTYGIYRIYSTYVYTKRTGAYIPNYYYSNVMWWCVSGACSEESGDDHNGGVEQGRTEFLVPGIQEIVGSSGIET